MSEVKEKRAIDVSACIRILEKRRSDLWSQAGGSKHAANVYASFLNGSRKPSTATQEQANLDGVDLMEKYRNLHAVSLAMHVIAKAHAKALSSELRALQFAARTAAFELEYREIR